MSEPRVLVVDDNPLNRELLRELLEDLGYAVDVASDGLEAVEAVDRIAYALVLMDAEMPALGGYDAAARIRAKESDRRVPIVAITAHSVASQRSKVSEAGMDDCLTKPIDEDALEATLARFAPRGAPSSEEPSTDSLAGLSPAIRALFERLVPEQIDALAAAAEARDGDALVRASHKLRGSCLTVGALHMASICEELERSPDLDRAPARIEALRAAFRSLSA